MSMRQLLNLTSGAVALMLIGAVIFAMGGGGGDADANNLALSAGQNAALGDVQRHARELSAAADLVDVNAARERLGTSIFVFDRNLSALLNGGSVAREDGTTLSVNAVSDKPTREALVAAARTWRRIGVPLADMAAGSFSAYSAAGQAALAGLEDGHLELTQQLGAVTVAMEDSLSGNASVTAWARGLAVGLLILLVGLLALRRFAGTAIVATSPTATVAPASAETVAPPPAAAPMPVAPPVATARVEPYTSPVDLEDVSLAVDRLAVDMNIVGTNSDKMRVAIDSVGHALHGMLFSLREMAKDTADGERLVRGAHSAASYTSEVAEALTKSVQEMSAVVASVSELARRTGRTAAQIDAEAAHSERSGKGFTRSVAAEVRSLAGRTAATTAVVEDTVSSMMATTREYEEAIGEIIQHVSAINRVSQGLGAIMLDPPTPDIVPAPSLAAPAPAVPAAPVPNAEALVGGDATDIGDETAAAIAEATAALNVDEPEAEAPEEPVAEEAPAAKPTFDLNPGKEAPEPESEPEEKPAVFVLSKAAPAEGGEAPDAVAAEPEPAAAAAPPPTEPAPEVVEDETISPGDAVMTVDDEDLEAALAELDAVPETPVPEPAAPAAAPAPASGAKQPQTVLVIDPEILATVEPDAKAAVPAAEPAAASASEPAEGEDPNIFMLNTPNQRPTSSAAKAEDAEEEVGDDFMIGGPVPAKKTVPTTG